MDKERKLQVIRSSRRTISLEVKPDLTVVVRVPLRMRERDIQAFLREKADWIERTIEKLEKQMKEAAKMLEFEYAAVLRDKLIKLRGEG